MLRRRGSRVLLVGALSALFALAYPSIARADLVVLQESNGFPGAGDAETARQKVSIGEDKLKVLDEAHGWALFVRLDKKVVQEVWAPEKSFVEKPLSFYAKIREDREKKRAEHIDEYKRQLDKAKDDSERANLKRELEKMGLREDGKTVARLESFDEKKKVTLIVDDARREVELVHHIVRENEGPAIFDVWVAPSIKAPNSVFGFYRAIGTFSDPVVAEVMKLDGFPVEISAVVDDGNNRKTLHSRVFEIRTAEAVEPVEYEVPAGFKVAEEHKAPVAGATKVACAICGKLCLPGSGDGSSFFTDPWVKKSYPVCSDEHRSELIKRLSAEQRQKPGPK